MKKNIHLKNWTVILERLLSLLVSGKTYVPIRTGAKNVKLSGRTAKKFSRLF